MIAAECVITSVKHATHADRVTIYQLGPENLLWTRHADGVEPPITPFWTEIGLGTAGLAASMGAAVTSMTDPEGDVSIASIRDDITGYRTRDLLAAPIFDREGSLLGVVECINSQSGNFSDADVEAVESRMDALREFLLAEDSEWRRQIEQALPGARAYLRLRSQLDWERGGPGLSYQRKFSGLRDYAREAAFLRDVLAARKPAGLRVLDLACGPGLHALELARLGLEVTGIDLDRERLKQAARSASQAGVRVHFLPADMTDFAAERSFDLIFNLFYGMQNVLLTRVQQERCLACARRNLAPGGLLVLDFLNEEANLRQFPPGVDHIADDGAQTGLRIVSRNRILDDLFKVMEMRFQLVDDPGDEVSESYPLRRMYAENARSLLEGAGFQIVAVNGDFEPGSPFDPQISSRMIVVAERA